MVLLVLAAGLVIIGVVWFLLRPLDARNEAVARRYELTAVRDRLIAQLDEWDAERTDQGVDAQVAGTEQRRLEFELAQVLKTLNPLPADPDQPSMVDLGRKKSPRWMLALVILALPLMALTLYVRQQQAALTLFAGVKQNQAQEMAGGGMPPKVLEMVARLEQRLQAQPDDARGWAQLGRSYAVLDRKAEAVTAYAKAYKLAPENIAILSDYAWLLYSEQPTEPKGQVVELYKKLHRLDPAQQDALWVLGLAAYKEGRRDQALGFWEKLLASLPQGSQAEITVRKAVAELKMKP
ncbi:MAG TPA: tetratricopeptide repeat protein [Acidiferrobacterales bacterium]|nr:tetratricopeptide repeat protein [Acidiferrobacterales bacterium]